MYLYSTGAPDGTETGARGRHSASPPSARTSSTELIGFQQPSAPSSPTTWMISSSCAGLYCSSKSRSVNEEEAPAAQATAWLIVRGELGLARLR